ncbi:MAG: hypothetical protein PQJ50_14435, partial [Spirochaetales bacterium]|nr:hypothetical protein [Spirochaetales bacterium]
TISQLFEKTDHQDLREWIHKFSGASSSLGLKGLHETLSDAERKIRVASLSQGVLTDLMADIIGKLDEFGELVIEDSGPKESSRVIPTVTDSDINYLKALLSMSDTSVIHYLENNESALKNHLKEEYASFKEAVMNYSFFEALQILEESDI